MLAAARPADFGLIMAEYYGRKRSSGAGAVERLIEAGGLRRLEAAVLAVAGSGLFAAPAARRLVPVRTGAQSSRLRQSSYHLNRCKINARAEDGAWAAFLAK